MNQIFNIASSSFLYSFQNAGMTRIEESRCCGVNCGRGATTAILMMTSFYGVVCLGFSLVARLYLKMYYCTAHVAAMAVFAAVFVIVHHVGRVRWALGLPPVGFYVLQVSISVCVAWKHQTPNWLLSCVATPRTFAEFSQM